MTTTKTKTTKLAIWERCWWNRSWAVLTLGAAIWGCTATTPPPPAETVGNLSAGPSVFTAPLAHDAPPAWGGVADTGDEIHAVGARKGDAPERADGVPETAPKTDGVTAGAVRE